MRQHSLLIAALAASLGFNYGLAVGVFHIPPFELLASLGNLAVKSEPKKPGMTIAPPPLRQSVDFERVMWRSVPFDYTDELRISDEAVAAIARPTRIGQLIQLRDTLVRHVWKKSAPPYGVLPQEVRNLADKRWRNMPNLGSAQEIIIKTSEYFIHHAFQFVPTRRENRLILIHQGHDGDPIKSKPLVERYLQKGFDVIVFAMPLLWHNKPTSQWIQTKAFGPILFPKDKRAGSSVHKYIPLLTSPDFNPVRLFVDPVIVALNQATLKGEFKAIIMVGLSGGGWTSTIVPALDPRIDLSIQVAGSLPFYLRSVRPNDDWGDYEQSSLPLYQIANYLELYLLAAVGEGRAHLQILNANDPCCFAQPAAEQYGRVLQQRIDEMQAPGEFMLYIDRTHSDHIISSYALDLIDDLIDVPQPRQSQSASAGLQSPLAPR